MGKRAGYIVQERVADVEAQAVTYTGGAVADGSGDSTSPASVVEGGAALYARVSSADQKADLDRQIARLSEFAAVHRLTVIDVVKETGSDLN